MFFFKKESKNKEKICIVYVTTFPPRECGIATFSFDLINYSDELFLGKVETKVVAMNTEASPKYKYTEKVIFQISQDEENDYLKVAEAINRMGEVKIVSIQHEFGIFGKNYGENLLIFLEKLEKPVVMTFHTVLPKPEEGMRIMMEKILKRAERVVVMTELSKQILIETYGALSEKIKIIPHGIHPQLYEDTTVAKNKLGYGPRFILTTFGLLSRGKGIEYAIRALPEIIKRYPNTLYLVLGATHPVVFKNEGEVYRNELIDLAKNLGVEKHVVFENQYLSKEDLLLFLQATDVYLSLSQNPDQAVSGTLSYALGAGRTVISTAFMQAREIVTPEVGALVGFGNSDEITKEVLKFLDDQELLLKMGKTAYFQTRKMTWDNVALSYMSLFSSIFPEISEKNKYMLPIKIDHIKKLTDDFGIFQFAKLHEPDPAWGYTLDDNARALVAMSWYHDLNPKLFTKTSLPFIEVVLSFIERCGKEDGSFVNYFAENRESHDELNQNENLEDANARALWALAVAATSNISKLLKIRAQNLFEKQFAKHQNISSPRAAAFCIKAFAQYYLHNNHNVAMRDQVEVYADFLVSLLEKSSDGKWKWFEDRLTYSNAIMPEALLVAYKITQNSKYFESAKTSLDFLVEHSFDGDVCVPVGQAGWFKKGEEKKHYDQQAEEVSALVLALYQMVLTSEDDSYRQKMILAFDWFLGNNLSHQVVYTHYTGGCYDGIHAGGLNLNQGAESTIAYLLARLIMEKS